MASASRSQLDQSSINITFPSRTRYQNQIQAHNQHHWELNKFGQLTDQEIGSVQDFTCSRCYPPNSYVLKATTQFTNFWEHWFTVIYQPRSGNALTAQYFDEALTASNEQDQTVALARLLLTVRFKHFPIEGCFEILKEICKAWDTTEGFSKMEALHIQSPFMSGTEPDLISLQDQEDEENLFTEGLSINPTQSPVDDSFSTTRSQFSIHRRIDSSSSLLDNDDINLDDNINKGTPGHHNFKPLSRKGKNPENPITFSHNTSTPDTASTLRSTPLKSILKTPSVPKIGRASCRER